LTCIKPEYMPPLGFLDSKQFRDLCDDFKLDRWRLTFYRELTYQMSYWSLEYLINKN